MTEETLSDLRLARKGDRDAGQRLVEENAGLIWSVVRRFLGRGVESEDLYQIGCVGFLKAVDGFDEEAEQFYGRSYADSPDIDGRIYFTADEPVAPGTFVTVRLTGTMDGELTGEMVE